MLDWLTPSERRGGMVLIVLLLIGTAWDLWRSRADSRLTRPPSAAGSDESVAPGDSAPVGPALAPAATRLIDLNQAGVPELDALPGIGPVLAARIVEQRRRGGPFRRIEDLLAVRGVGPRLLERLKAHVQLGVSAPEVSTRSGVQSAPRGSSGLADSTSVVPRSAR